MKKLPTYSILLAVMLVCIMAKVGYASAIDRLTYEYHGNHVKSIIDDASDLVLFQNLGLPMNKSKQCKFKKW